MRPVVRIYLTSFAPTGVPYYEIDRFHKTIISGRIPQIV